MSASRHIRKKERRQHGDTIVEVIIAVAIVSSVLAGAFTVSQKSALAVRSSQEHGEMLQLLQGQVETVRAIALQAEAKTAPIYSTSPRYFCIDESSKNRSNFDSSVVQLPESDDDDYSSYPVACKGLGASNLYNVAIRYEPSTKVFTFIG
ncbi:MAG TPA: prepilin-type N-terminal cleavage/methylation domain-containing protein, partial [Candidatus Saccharimonadales bacterium]|nr:prepilin-type N-terminal cleavage/methylation domain-containing protein [Candidatus Saccharimonadales bacterium]